MTSQVSYFQSLDLLPPHFKRLQAPSIWLRDFMPLQTPCGRLAGFDYGCRYMYDFGEEIFDPQEIWNQLGLKVLRIPILADGGHFIEASRHWLVSRALLEENPNLNESQITGWLQRALGKPILWIPPVPGDFTGHLDAYVRWIKGDILLVYRRLPAITTWQRAVHGLLRREGYTLIEVTGYLSDDPMSADGLCLNYASDEDTIYIGGFEERFPGLDELLKRLLAKSDMRFINCDSVLEQGGGLHCVTWEYGI